MKAIGIFGGTFDPIHLGHLRSAFEVSEQLSLSEMQFVPSASPVHRDMPQVPAIHRLAMVAQAIQYMPGWTVNDCEIRRGGPSYMVDTLHTIRAEVGNETALWLLVGSDAFEGFVRWHRWQEILSLTNLAVMVRAGISPEGCEQTQSLLASADAEQYMQVSGQVRLLSVTALDISSTRIRDGLALGIVPEFLVMPDVLTYIRDHGLYQ